MASITILKILQEVHTKEDRDRLLDALARIEESLYRSSPDALDAAIRGYVPQHLAPVVRETFVHVPSVQNRDLFTKILTELRQELENVAILRIDIAFEPTEKNIQRISTWVREHIGEGVLLEIGYDKTIFGGARIMFNGRFTEITLAWLIERALKAEKDTLLLK